MRIAPRRPPARTEPETRRFGQEVVEGRKTFGRADRPGRRPPRTGARRRRRRRIRARSTVLAENRATPVDGVARRGSASATGNFAPGPTPTYKDSVRRKSRRPDCKMRPKARHRPKSRFSGRPLTAFPSSPREKKAAARSPRGGRSNASSPAPEDRIPPTRGGVKSYIWAGVEPCAPKVRIFVREDFNG